MSEFFRGKTIVVTGGSSGIGYWTAAKLLEYGANVHILDMRPLDEEYHPQYPTTGKVYTHIPVDISKREGVHDVFEEIFKISPDVYGLVNCAGGNVTEPGLPLLAGDASFYKNIEVNLYGAWHCATELLNHIMATREPYPREVPITAEKQIASIVNISSAAALHPVPGVAPYSGAKSAVQAFSRVWARDFAQYGVRSNTVCPGPTSSAAAVREIKSTSAALKGTLESQIAATPMRRMGDPQEQADAIIFFLSDKASFVTGQYLCPNGGWF